MQWPFVHLVCSRLLSSPESVEDGRTLGSQGLGPVMGSNLLTHKAKTHLLTLEALIIYLFKGSLPLERNKVREGEL